MTERWPLIEVIEVCETVVDCVNKTAPLAEEATPYKMLRTTNVRDGYVDTANCRFVSRDVYEKWTRRQVPRRGDVILTREAPLGEVGMLRDDETVFLGQRLMSYRADPSKLDANFLLYSLMGPELQAQIRATGSGATVEHMRVPDAERLKIRLPDLSTQQRIGTILASYDAFILNNQRRIAILEDMARRLFDEWFVRFRYPGSEAVPLVETDVGMVPEGWAVIRAEEMIDFDPRTKVPKEGIKRFVPMGSLDTVSSVISNWETRSGNSGSKFHNGDTLFARITPCLENGKTGLVNFLEAGETAFGSTEFTVMRGKGVSSSFVYLLARSEAFRAIAIKSMGGADGRQRVRTEALKGYEFARPTAGLLTNFASIAEPMFEQVRVLANQNSRLRAARDLLLPKLISGEIDVSAVEETFAEAAE
ncbi:restriction endonuclease subunit S [Agrobacterium tumefaciens]|nr:restriction endonuclease subunit S [Agrobacterium tumefaciens]